MIFYDLGHGGEKVLEVVNLGREPVLCVTDRPFFRQAHIGDADFNEGSSRLQQRPQPARASID